MEKLIRIFIALALIGGLGFALVKNSDRQPQQPKQQTQPELSELQQELADVPELKPVSAKDFGDHRLVTSNPNDLHIQKPDGPSKIGGQANTDQYQAVLYKNSDTFFRVLYGRLTDKSEGKLELQDAYELVVQQLQDGTRDVSLRAAEPDTIELETTKIVRWANLPGDDAIVQAIRSFEKQSTEGL